jgi:glucose-1-phosphate cytidylyltransferase
VKVLILAGGVGSRISEETEPRPKPMVEIGRRPILWHIMKSFADFGFSEFVVAAGHRGERIKQYFAERTALEGDTTFDFRTGAVHNHQRRQDEWTVTLLDTGLHTETAGRMVRARSHLGDGTFMMTYGDSVADIDHAQLLAFHRSHRKLATVCAVHPVARRGHLEIGDDDLVRVFHAEPQMDDGWISGGVFVLEPDVFDVISGDCDWSKEPLQRLTAAGQLVGYRHKGFWHCLDTLRDKQYLDALWESGEAPWRTWNPGP